MDWQVTVLTQSNLLKTVIVRNCGTQRDAEEEALGITGGKRALFCNVVNLSSSSNYDTSTNSNDTNGIGIVVILGFIAIVAAWKYILIFGLVGFSIWYFFNKDR